jgi:hypothetical protein
MVHLSMRISENILHMNERNWSSIYILTDSFIKSNMQTGRLLSRNGEETSIGFSPSKASTDRL